MNVANGYHAVGVAILCFGCASASEASLREIEAKTKAVCACVDAWCLKAISNVGEGFFVDVVNLPAKDRARGKELEAELYGCVNAFRSPSVAAAKPKPSDVSSVAATKPKPSAPPSLAIVVEELGLQLDLLNGTILVVDEKKGAVLSSPKVSMISVMADPVYVAGNKVTTTIKRELRMFGGPIKSKDIVSVSQEGGWDISLTVVGKGGVEIYFSRVRRTIDGKAVDCTSSSMSRAERDHAHSSCKTLRSAP